MSSVNRKAASAARGRPQAAKWLVVALVAILLSHSLMGCIDICSHPAEYIIPLPYGHWQQTFDCDGHLISSEFVIDGYHHLCRKCGTMLD